jgi:hypothetical protein
MKLRLPNTSEVPPGGWKYWVHETNTWVHSWADYDTFKAQVVKHLQANNLPAALNIEDLIQDQICRRLEPGRCQSTDVPMIGGIPATLETFFRGTRTIGAWLLSGESVGEEEADRRSMICAHCPLNEGVHGCPSCQMGKIAALVVTYIKQLKQYPFLKSCRVCGCALNVKIYVPKAEIVKREPAELRVKYPDHCWMAGED